MLVTLDFGDTVTKSGDHGPAQRRGPEAESVKRGRRW
jgi:hypothetical protein